MIFQRVKLNSIRLGMMFFLFFLFFLFFFSFIVKAVPDGVSNINVISNETSVSGAGTYINISGGRIATINFTATTQNPRWKAFVGNVTGAFTLDDASGSTIYDWTLTTVAGEVYATRNSSTVIWSQIKCANTTVLENENGNMSHTSADDNITATFDDTTHSEFFVGDVNITVNTCPTLNTYVNNVSQDTSFEEVALFDGATEGAGTVVYATIMEAGVTGFDSNSYDFQMIVPEVGTEGFAGATAYYLYAELT